MKTIIFDFNRTIFDPDSGALATGAKKVLRTLQTRGFALLLLSRKERGRKERVRTLDIERNFLGVYFVDEKTSQEFQRLFAAHSVSIPESYVIGDRLEEEIAIGNEFGLRTIWIKHGDGEIESKIRPAFIAKSLSDVLKFIS